MVTYTWFNAESNEMLGTQNSISTANLYDNSQFIVNAVKTSGVAPTADNVFVGDIVTSNNIVVRPSMWMEAEIQNLEAIGVVYAKNNDSVRVVGLDEYTNIPWGASRFTTGQYATSYSDARTKMNGKAMTDAIVAYNNSQSTPTEANYVAALKAREKGENWYLPAEGELFTMENNLANVNYAISMVGGTEVDANSYYWSVTERSSDRAWSSIGTGTQDDSKSTSHNVRPVTAFTYSDLINFRNSATCRANDTHSVAVTPQQIGNTTATVELGQSFTYRDSTAVFNDAGEFDLQWTFHNAGDCDSIVNIAVTVLPRTITVTPQANQHKNCGQADPTFLYSTSENINGITGQISREAGESVGTYQYTLGTLDAGDNYILVLNENSPSFEILPVYNEVTISQCNSYEWNGTSYTTSGDYTQHLQTIHGCDSAVTLHLIISHSSTSEFTASGCENYTWNNQTYTQSGDYTQTFSNAVGCDSTVTLHLTIYNPVHTAVTQLACESYTWHGQTYTQSGTYTYSHTDAHGCTQVDTLHLDIGHPQHTATTETACETFTWNGQTYTQSGNYTYSHTDAHGCTQVDTLHLTVHHAVHEATTEVVCDSYTWNGQTYTQSGNYTYSHTDANGCTQVDTLHLTVHYSANTEEQLVLCREELPYSWNDTIFDTDAPTSATLVFHFLTVEGCDSTVTLQLTVHDPVHTAESDFACEPYHWNGQTYTESGTYTFAHPDANGCTQVDTLHLTFLDTTILIVPLTHNFCDNGSLTLEVQCALEDYLWSTGETSTTITVFDEGTYTVTASQGSCEVEASYTIVPCEYELLLPNAITPDGDGLNDEFSIPEAYFDHIGDAVFNVWIYNRWGTLVYSANSKYFRWNGEVDGKIYHHNVYNYVIFCEDIIGRPYILRGTLTVL